MVDVALLGIEFSWYPHPMFLAEATEAVRLDICFRPPSGVEQGQWGV